MEFKDAEKITQEKYNISYPINNMTNFSAVYKKSAVEDNRHWFDKSTMKFFGERLSDYKLKPFIERCRDYAGKWHECYVVQFKAYTPQSKRYYFDIETFDVIN